MALALATGAVAVAPAASACACGGFVETPGHDTAITAETAVLQWDGSTQTILLELAGLSTAPEVGLLLPTPAPAEVELGDPQTFVELDELTRPQPVVVGYRWWPRLGFGDDGVAGGAPGAVEVHDQVRLGPLDVTTLSASDTDALDAWLEENGFVLPDGFGGAIAPYVDEGWAFVAARIAPEEEGFDGALQPLRVTFPTEELVYPMRMSAVATETQRVRTYVLGDQRVDRADPTAEATAPEVRFAGRVDPASVTTPELAALLRAGDYVTSHEQTFTSPDEEVLSDFVFAPSDGPDVARTYTMVADRRIGAFYAGPVLAFGGFLLLAVVVVVVAHRHLTRDRARRARLRAEAAAQTGSPARARV